MALPPARARTAVRPAGHAAAAIPKESGLKLGILGGTFDPVHNAHLAIAKSAMQSLGLDRILWIPTGKPGYRTPPVATAFDRIAMLALALKDDEAYELDSRELAPGASPFTVDTLTTLRAERPDDEFYLLLGADQFAALRGWHRPADVKRLARIAVVTRPGYQVGSGEALVVPMSPLAISASDVRARAKRGDSLDALVPPAVAKYITENRLYR